MPREAERRHRDRDPDRERRHRERDPDRERRHRERELREADPDGEREYRERDPERERERERRRRERERRRSHNPDRDSRDSRSRDEPPSSRSSAAPLSADSLAKLNYLNEKRRTREPAARQERPKKKRPREGYSDKYEQIVVEKPKRHKKRKRRVVSGALLEEGDGKRLSDLRGGDYGNENEEDASKRKKKRIWIIVGVIILLLAIIIPVAVVLSNKNKDASTQPASTPSTSSDGNSNLDGVDPASVPQAAKGTDLDPFSWLDTTDFNVTYTAETVGGLPVIGLFSKWDDSAKANDKVPALDESWGSYDTRPARGVNLGGWLSVEPFITPSLFDSYDSKLGIVDEWTLCEHLGPSPAKETLEKHYSTFVTEETFANIKDAGLDHVRIPFSYWAVKLFDGEPYVERVAWRYLLRAIEWSRKYGLRINLDLHGLPGSQNGWNHSGHQGPIGWLNGTDGVLNGQRALDIHRSLSQFFAQPRYKNIIAFYGLVNEPKMTALKTSDVNAWTASAYQIIRESGITAPLVFGDGFLGLANWQGQLQSYAGLVLDVHQYVIFNTGQIVFNHTAKVTYACAGWSEQAQQSMDVATGFGPTLFAEWSQADTDCATYLNNVGWGNRWEGTYDTGNPLTRVLSATCPTNNGGPTCTCGPANADPGQYSDDYKSFLQMFAEAQMHSFEQGWGWFYWTWKTETAAQWSYERGLAAGILPKKAYAPEFNCTQEIPSFGELPENY